MRVALVDVDGHNFPNLALMRLSAYHKSRGDTVEWNFQLDHYDLCYKSKVFSAAYSKDVDVINSDKVVQGGTGYAIRLEGGKEVYHPQEDGTLPAEIESCRPDYSLYPQYKYAVSMTTRGCPRGCQFCHVAPKEGKRSVRVADVQDFWIGQPEIKVLDPNILACTDRVKLLNQYADTKAKIDYTQGLDIRLLDAECAEILNRTRMAEIHFAWDNPKEDLTSYFARWAKMTKHRPHGACGTVYVLTGYNSSIEEDLYRIQALRGLGYDPYVMIYDKPHAEKNIKDLQRWCNNRTIFKACPDFAKYRKGIER